ncbi:putative N6-adenine-specific DNA methylase [Salinibacillus kushneri]|uniref:Putative N6-adenine-specific DNA methylase n=1 Tax=Salinibacillus kushneri TaxID=237682 RepID=A0A1I0DGR6_9BACI|nr:class I SAM-dependent RNA methyltransferase [Salinibacillus kushneri]SET31538.1 putative N6-adenine-specific DNA methylase [Salinibacillus kushneri]
MSGPYTLIATAAAGLESLVAKEVKELGFNEVNVENGRVTYQSDALGISRSNLWLRTADRVKLLVGEFEAKTFDELYEQTKALPWESFVPENGAIPVVGKSVKSQLHSVPDCQSIVKKAIVDRMAKKHGLVGKLPENGALYRVEVALLKDRATLTIDTSGEGLHRRGYRIEQNEAPLKETLAAALVELTNWRPNDSFIDPFTGSGTIPIEAALIGQNIAPGFNREFASEEWEIVPQKLWDEALTEAEDVANYDQPLDISGYDIDHRMIEISEKNALEAGLADLINWKQMQVRDLNPATPNGYLIGNPPYGERLGDRKEVEQIYRDLGKIMNQHPSWSVYIITSYKDFEKVYGKQATKKRKLYNGYIRTDYYQYFGKRQK